MKHFHVMSDKKTIRELSHKDYMRKLTRKDWMLGWIDDRGILFARNQDVICLSLEQLRQILELNKTEP